MSKLKLTTIQSPNSEFIPGTKARFEAASDGDYEVIREMEKTAREVVFETKVTP